MDRVKTFTDRYPLIGPSIWMLSIQYFIIQAIAILRYIPSYSLRFNTISDLGNSACGTYSGRAVCSPLHNLMNASFILLGVTMATGSLLIYQEFKKNKAALAAFSLMAVAGVGTAIVGLFPENSISALHTSGAALSFVLGNIALVIFSFSLAIPRLFRYFTLIAGVVSLAALSLFLGKSYLGLGIGGMERIVAYPQTVWLIVFGLYISKNHFIKKA